MAVYRHSSLSVVLAHYSVTCKPITVAHGGHCIKISFCTNKIIISVIRTN